MISTKRTGELLIPHQSPSMTNKVSSFLQTWLSQALFSSFLEITATSLAL